MICIWYNLVVEYNVKLLLRMILSVLMWSLTYSFKLAAKLIRIRNTTDIVYILEYKETGLG